jgi:hypothetical protein
MPRATVATVAVLVVSLACGPARADDKHTCIEASENAQQLRLDGKLTEARARLLDCMRPECPVIVRQDCEQWTSQVLAAIPTVVPGARDDQGRDVFDVRVSMDGMLVAERLDGRPIPVDPGVHSFRFEAMAAAGASAEVQVLVRAGEQNRPITVTLGRAAPATPVAPSSTGAAPGSVRTVGWILAGVGVAALGTALAFDIKQAIDYSHLESTCAGHCAPSDVNQVSTERWIAVVAAGIGVVQLGSAALFLLPHRSAPPSPPAAAAGLTLDFTAVPGGGMGAVSGRF